jgi:predicted phage terminase large subunit-like protein
VQSWDTAYKDRDINDPSVCTTWGQTRHGYYLLDVYRDRLQFPDLRRAAISQAQKWGPHAVLIEDKSSGQALIQELRQGIRAPDGSTLSIPVVPIQPQGSKLDRAVAVSSLFDAGLVFVPEHAPWLTDLEMELIAFPNSAHDDQVDSITQFLHWAHSTSTRIDYHAMSRPRAGAVAYDDRTAGYTAGDTGGWM